MTLIQKIKSYFIKRRFHLWNDFHWDGHDLKFHSVNNETLLDIGSYIKNNLEESTEIGNKRHRLIEAKGIKCATLNELLPLLREIITADFKQTSIESMFHDWEFEYFVGRHALCENTICISNGLRDRDGQGGHCVYPLATVRKHDNHYFCWNHVK